jgi:hypothetical protein
MKHLELNSQTGNGRAVFWRTAGKAQGASTNAALCNGEAVPPGARQKTARRVADLWQRDHLLFVRRVLIASILTLAFRSARAQPYIDWYKISGGGGSSAGGTFQFSGTIGQADAGVAMNGCNYSLTGGFWSLINVLQTAGAPTLYISNSGSTVTVYWQNAGTWTLQQNPDLTTSGWSTNCSWTTSNGTNSLIINNPAGNLFFRLKQ